jgi:hypothetical protein
MNLSCPPGARRVEAEADVFVVRCEDRAQLREHRWLLQPQAARGLVASAADRDTAEAAPCGEGMVTVAASGGFPPFAPVRGSRGLTISRPWSKFNQAKNANS